MNAPEPTTARPNILHHPRIQAAWERIAQALHAIHGSRGILAGSLGLLLLGLADPALPRDLNRTLLTGPLLLVLIAGLLTLAREGVATQQRARTLRNDETATRKMTRRLLWLLPLTLLLSPRIFLAAYGVPHLNPLTGVIFPDTQRHLALLFLFLLMLLAAMYLRSSKRYAPHIRSRRPRDLPHEDLSHQERDWLLWMVIGIALAWGWLLRPFWHPFSLLQWPPSLNSLQQGAAGVGALAFSLAIPMMLFLNLASHLSLLRDIQIAGTWHKDRHIAAMAAIHVTLSLTAIILHAYDLLWIAQYRSAVRF